MALANRRGVRFPAAGCDRAAGRTHDQPGGGPGASALRVNPAGWPAHPDLPAAGDAAGRHRHVHSQAAPVAPAAGGPGPGRSVRGGERGAGPGPRGGCEAGRALPGEGLDGVPCRGGEGAQDDRHGRPDRQRQERSVAAPAGCGAGRAPHRDHRKRPGVWRGRTAQPGQPVLQRRPRRSAGGGCREGILADVSVDHRLPGGSRPGVLRAHARHSERAQQLHLLAWRRRRRGGRHVHDAASA